MSSFYQRVDGCAVETEGTVAADVRNDKHVAHFGMFYVCFVRGDVEELLHDLGQGAGVFGIVLALVAYVNTDDDVSPHLFADIRREIVPEAAVDQGHVVQLDGGEHSGDCHGCPYGCRQVAAVEHYLLVRNQVYGNAGERYGKVVEIDVILVAHAETGQQVQHVLSVDDSGRKTGGEIGDAGGVAVSPSVQIVEKSQTGDERHVQQVAHIAPFPLCGQFAAFYGVAHVDGPVHTADDGVQLVSLVAESIHSAHY